MYPLCGDIVAMDKPNCPFAKNSQCYNTFYRLYRTVIEEYKYNSAKREILYLNKLRGLKGIPRMLGSCVEDLRIR